MLTWQKPASIIPRRRAEESLFRASIYPTGRLNVWQVSSSGAVIWRPVRTLSADELLAMLGQGADPVAAWREAAPAPIEKIRDWLGAKPEGVAI